jgi:hypothetical protein
LASTESSGWVFVNTLLKIADTFFTAEVMYLKEDMEILETMCQDKAVVKPNQISKIFFVIELEIANLKDGSNRPRLMTAWSCLVFEKN